MTVSAPGKMFLLGEYVVLDGHGALIAAVERRVHATFTPGGDGLFLSGSLHAAPVRVDDGFAWAAASAAREWLRSDAPMYGLLHIDSSALFDRSGRKLGFGSSAAVVVAATGAIVQALAPEQQPPTFALLRHWHNVAQQSAGSGGDVAASLLGGLVWLEQGIAQQVSATAPPLAVFKHAQAASTPSMTKAVRAFATRDSAAYAPLATRLIAAATTGRDALARRDDPLWVAACREANLALDALGVAAGAPIATDAHRALVAQVEALGGACKPSGAGGGDISLVTAADAPTMQRLVASLGLEPLTLATAGLSA